MVDSVERGLRKHMKQKFQILALMFRPLNYQGNHNNYEMIHPKSYSFTDTYIIQTSLKSVSWSTRNFMRFYSTCIEKKEKL